MVNSILSDKRLRFFFSAWWLVWAFIQYIMLKEIHVDDKHAIIDSVVSIGLLAALCFFISNNMKYYLPRKEKYWYLLIISLTLSGVWILLQHGALWVIFPEEDTYADIIHSSSGIRYAAGFLLISSMSMFSLLWYSQREQKELDARKSEAEHLTREAELFKLRQQLQPHFLFNSLNSISALTGSQPEKARHMIQQLSDFLRGTLKKDDQQWSTLEEEIQYLGLYLDIEKVRFGHRLQTEIHVSDGVLSLKLPALLLQPVVENAIKFGLYDTTGDITICIDAHKDDNHLVVQVRNPFDPETSSPKKGTGFGLSSVQRRLYLLFARNDLVQTEVREQLFITTIKIPQQK